jgi:ABC-type molybdate transport system substrate-binding protein
MKKIFAVLICLLMFTGCAAFQGQGANTALNASIDVAYVAALQNNPTYKEGVVHGLTLVLEYVNCTECTIEELKLEIIKSFPDKYKIYGVVLSDYVDDTYVASIFSDKITPESKAVIIKKVDRLIKLAELIK